MHRCPVSDFPPFGICIINIIIIIIIISSSVCWSLQSAETNGQYLSRETWAAPGSPCGHLPAAFLAPLPPSRVVALLLYLDKLSSVTADSSGGRSSSERGEQGCTHPGLLRKPGSEETCPSPVLLPNPAQALPACATVVCKARKYYYYW